MERSPRDKEKLTKVVHVDKKFSVIPMLQRGSSSSAGTERMEIDANRFAAELLMPKGRLIEALAGKIFDIDDEKPIGELAKKFQVSKQAIEFRIRNLAFELR